MATGASTSDLAIILIDAQQGVQEQTRRHAYIASLFGIKHVIVAINKMDQVEFEKTVFDDIKEDYLAFAERLEFGELCFVPLSALHGDNVVERSKRTAWYHGETLMTILENVEIASDHNYTDLRFPVQYVNRPNPDFRGFCGTLASGVVHKGDRVKVLPSGKSSVVKSIVTYDEELEHAFTPMAITLTLEDEIDISRGDMLVHSDNLPSVGNQFEATLVWMAEMPMMPGKRYDFKHAHQVISGRISALKQRIDISTFKETQESSLQLNEIGRCEITLEQTICFDCYRTNRVTGSFIVIDRMSNATVGGGVITGGGQDPVASDVKTPQRSVSHVTVEERSRRYGHKPVTILFIGLSGSGKTTLAHALERRLFDMGHICTVLDGKTMRLGISKDLPRDEAGRAENLHRSAYIAKHLNDSGLICCAAFVAPNQASRDQAADIAGKENCLIVYLNPPLEICRHRDPSGLYAAAEGGSLGNLPGVSFPYEAPEDAALVLATDKLSVTECVERIIELLNERSVF